MINQIQSAIPKDRANLEHFISTELLRVIACIEKNSSQTEIVDLRDTLLAELSSQHSNVEDIIWQLENGFQSISESLEDVHTKFDEVTQSILDFHENFGSQLNSLKSKEIVRDDIIPIIESIGFSQSQVEKAQAKEKLTNQEVMNLISRLIPTIQINLESLNLSHQQSFSRFQNELKSKCEESQEDQIQLQTTLNQLTQLVSSINQKLNSLLPPPSVQNSLPQTQSV